MAGNEKPRQESDGKPSAERIAKRIARAGLCSRRDAERWIADGRVAVDGETLTSPAVTVTAASKIEVDGKPLPAAEAPRLFRFHKPTGYLTASRDPEGRKTIADIMPAGLPRLMPIGRLDMNSEGLLLLTNDGALKRQLELPATGWQRRYRVRVHGDVNEAKLASLIKGITIDGFDYGPIEAHLERAVGKNAWLSIALREGKNREIRKVMEHFGWPVNRLIRVSFGPFHLGNLAKMAVDEIKTKVVKEQIGLVLRSTTPKSQRKRRLTASRTKTAEVVPESEAKPAARRQETLTLKKRSREGAKAKRQAVSSKEAGRGRSRSVKPTAGKTEGRNGRGSRS
ncbi:MAG: pseudouridine synthase [Geminicoccaceae bacterium]